MRRGGGPCGQATVGKEGLCPMGRKYRPVLFIVLVCAVTWPCAVLMALLDGGSWGAALMLLDFLKSASPLLVALLLLRNFQGGFLRRFFCGKREPLRNYMIVAALFAGQFLNFYLFRYDGGAVSLSLFLTTFAGQIVFGGALEEGGWRGYLQPALERRCHTLLAALCVGLVWAGWHLPYFVLPGNMHSGGNFLFYAATAVATSFILAAIHRLTGSVLICTLFHGWQNTIVMTVQADMGRVGFLLFFILLVLVSMAICAAPAKRNPAAADG